MRLWADVYDAAGNRLGAGPVLTLTSASVTRALDGAGSVSVSAPLADDRARSLLTNERRIRIFVEHDGTTRELGRGIIRKVDVGATSSGWSLSADGPDSFDELKRVNVLLNRQYSDQAVSSIVNSLVGLASWTATNDSGMGNTSARFDGASILKALQELANNKGYHIRLGTSPGVVEFGAFGTDTGLRLVNPERAGYDLYSNDQILLIERVSLAMETEAVANWLLPVGAGEGNAALTLAKSTRTTPYTIQSTTGPDGKTLYYLSDATSITAYGQIQKVGTFKDIAPLSNSDADVTLAANALYDAAAAWLERYSVRQDTYRVTCRKARTNIRPGDKVRLIYKGVIDREDGSSTYLDIDEVMWVMKVTEKIGLEGVTTALEISTVDKYQEDSATLVLGALEAIEIRNLKVQPYPSSRSYVRYEEMDSTHSVIVPIKVTDATLDVTRVQFTMITRPLRATAKAAKDGGGTTTSSGGSYSDTLTSGLYEDWNGGDPVVTGPAYQNTSSLANHNHVVGDHRHTLTISIPNHTHTTPNHTHDIDYGIYDDNLHPQTISVWINGINRTAALGGTWAASNAPVTVELDITEYITGASGGLRQEHEIEIRCASGQGTVETLVEIFEIVQAINLA
jgi:hypothetical protein